MPFTESAKMDIAAALQAMEHTGCIHGGAVRTDKAGLYNLVCMRDLPCKRINIADCEGCIHKQGGETDV